MSQNDFTLANQSFPAFRADLNSALQALASNSSGATAPSTTFANMWWYDSANNIMYIRNEDNDAWIKFAELDQANDKFVLSGTLQLDDGTVSAPALTFNSDTNMGIYRGGTDILKFVTAGTDAITIDASQDVTLAGSLNFADNEKAIFGAGSDLQIYHSGTSSHIGDVGTGNLFIYGDGDVQILNQALTQYKARFITGGAVDLWHNAVKKFSTTSAGIDVTGLVVSDGMQTNTAGANNFIAGINAGISITSGGNFNVAVGDYAGTALTTGDNNTALGFEAGKTINTASLNTLIGSYSGRLIDTGIENVGLGYNTLGSDVKGSNSVAIGSKALQVQIFASGTNSNNTAVGHNAGKSVTTGIENTLIGAVAGDALNDADYNVAIGSSALSADTKGNKSIAIGHASLGTQNLITSTDIYNVGIGHQSGTAITTGGTNTLVGGLTATLLQTGSSNAMLGFQAGNAITSSISNTFIGTRAGALMTSGQKNTILGRYDGNQGGLDIRTLSNSIVLSDGDGNPHGYYRSNQWTFQISTNNLFTTTSRVNGVHANPYGIGIVYTNSSPDDQNGRFLTCQDSTTARLYIYNDGDVVNHDNSYGAISDIKLKEQITDASSQWNDIKALTVRKYKMKSDVAEKGDSDEHWRLGVIAQEVEEAGMSGLIKNSPDKDADNNDLGTITKEVKYSILYMKAVKALQEAMERIETLEAKVATLEGA